MRRIHHFCNHDIFFRIPKLHVVNVVYKELNLTFISVKLFGTNFAIGASNKVNGEQ